VRKKKKQNKFFSPVKSLPLNVFRVTFVRDFSTIFDDLVTCYEQIPLKVTKGVKCSFANICCILGRYGVHAFLLLGSPLYLRTAASNNLVPSPRKPNRE